MNCHNCGLEVQKREYYCRHCGAKKRRSFFIYTCSLCDLPGCTTDFCSTYGVSPRANSFDRVMMEARVKRYQNIERHDK